MVNKSRKLTLSFSIGEGYNRDIKKEFVSLDDGIRQLERDLRSKYGCELSSYLNGSNQKKEFKKVNKRW